MLPPPGHQAGRGGWCRSSGAASRKVPGWCRWWGWCTYWPSSPPAPPTPPRGLSLVSSAAMWPLSACSWAQWARSAWLVWLPAATWASRAPHLASSCACTAALRSYWRHSCACLACSCSKLRCASCWRRLGAGASGWPCWCADRGGAQGMLAAALEAGEPQATGRAHEASEGCAAPCQLWRDDRAPWLACAAAYAMRTACRAATGLLDESALSRERVSLSPSPPCSSPAIDERIRCVGRGHARPFWSEVLVLRLLRHHSMIRGSAAARPATSQISSADSCLAAAAPPPAPRWTCCWPWTALSEAGWNSAPAGPRLWPCDEPTAGCCTAPRGGSHCPGLA